MATVTARKKRRSNADAPVSPLVNGSSSASTIRSGRGLPSVNEVINGKVQEVFVLDDDESPPPSMPLAVEAAERADASRGDNYTYTNGAYGQEFPYTERDNDAGSSNGHYSASSANTVAATKGKRKAAGSVPPSSAGASEDVEEQGVDGVKRRKRDHQAAGPPLPVQQPFRQQQQFPADYAAPGPSAPSFYIGVAAALPPPQPAPASYRGGYAGGAALDYSRTNGIAVGTGSYYDGTASARESYASQNSVQQQPPPPQLPCDDKEGHFIVREGDQVGSRYKIMSQLGQGTFGKVVECYDRETHKYVAIKIIRAIQKYRDASKIEIRVLQTLRTNDPANENKCIHLLDSFNYRNHVCIVSELLGKSVFDFLKENEFNPFPARHIWNFAKQLLKSVAFLHRLNLVHTDLKPENILLVSSDHEIVSSSRRPNAKRKRILHNTEIRLIDFGSATFDNEYHSAVVSTRHYRAPEIILGMGWSFPCDVWSIGCILVEFFTGDALFQTHDNLEHLAMMEAVLGVMPEDFRRKAETYKPELFRAGKLDYPNNTTQKNSRRYVRQMKKLQDVVPPSAAHAKHNQRFLHLLRRLLDFDPARRIKVSEALSHPYFDLQPNDFPS